jgi:hypothetical protein
MRTEQEVEELEAGQPGALQIDRLAIDSGRLIKASMHTELQKFGSIDRLSLLDPQPEEEPVQITGLKLTNSQDRALHAIQILLDRTDHEGNRPGRPALSDGYHGYQVPRLAIEYGDYFEAYGLETATDGWTRQHNLALQALRDLAQPRRIVYKRTRYTGTGQQRRQVTDAIAVHSPLITFVEAYEGMEPDEEAAFDRGEDIPAKRARRFIIDCHPVLIDQIETFYILKPERLHEEIKELHPDGKIPATIIRFINLLLTVNLDTWQISEDNLLQKLWLYESFYEHRNKSRIRKRIKQACEDAQKLGFLLDWQRKKTGVYVFKRNPERCRRVDSKRKRGEDHGET